MIISIRRTDNKIKFDDISVGQAFIWENDEKLRPFIKIPPTEARPCIYNAVDLETGDLESFPNCIVILPKIYSFNFEV